MDEVKSLTKIRVYNVAGNKSFLTTCWNYKKSSPDESLGENSVRIMCLKTPDIQRVMADAERAGFFIKESSIYRNAGLG